MSLHRLTSRSSRGFWRAISGVSGEHRIACGNAGDATLIGRLFNDTKPSVLFTSPPYDQQRDYGLAEGVGDWTDLMSCVFEAAPYRNDTQVLVNLGLIHRELEWQPYWSDWMEAMRGSGWKRFGWYVWDKRPALPGAWHGRLGPCFEFVFHFNRQECGEGGGPKYESAPEKGWETQDLQPRRSSDARRTYSGGDCEPSPCDRQDRAPRGLSVGLPRYFIAAYSDLRDPIYDPFVGSGSTILACEQSARRCYGVDISPSYCDVAIQRWETFTDQKAQRA